jgi:hypothetical protein
MDDGGVPLATVDDDRDGCCANDGYGRAGGAVGGVISPLAPTDRSVAVEASGRRGNVTSDIMDVRDACRGCGVCICVEGAEGIKVVRFVSPFVLGPEFTRLIEDVIAFEREKHLWIEHPSPNHLNHSHRYTTR